MWLNGKAPLTRQSYRSTWAQFSQFIPKPLHQVTLEDLQFYQYWVGTKYKYTTVQTKLAGVRSLFKFAFKIGYLPFNPAHALDKARPDKEDIEKQSLDVIERIISPEDVIKLINGGSCERDRVFLKTIYLLGLRAHEATNLHWRNVTPSKDGGFKVKITGKNSKIRYNKIPPGLYEELKGLGTEGYIFQSNRKKRLGRTQAHRIIKKAAKRAQLGEEISLHWLRHAHASHTLDNGAPLKAVQQQLGHSSIAVTSIYLHSSEASSDYLSI